jgi:hypothetical protein
MFRVLGSGHNGSGRTVVSGLIKVSTFRCSVVGCQGICIQSDITIIELVVVIENQAFIEDEEQ